MEKIITSTGIAVITYPPYVQGRNLLSNTLEKLHMTCLFIDANTKNFAEMLNRKGVANETFVNLSSAQCLWSQVLKSSHHFALSELSNLGPLEYPQILHWIVMDDDIFIETTFRFLLNKLITSVPSDYDVILLVSDEFLCDITVKNPFDDFVKNPFPALTQQGAYLVSANRLQAVADAILNDDTGSLNAYAYLGCPPIVFPFRDDILPCTLRRRHETAPPEPSLPS